FDAVAAILLVDVRDPFLTGLIEYAQPGVEARRVGQGCFDLEGEPRPRGEGELERIDVSGPADRPFDQSRHGHGRGRVARVIRLAFAHYRDRVVRRWGRGRDRPGSRARRVGRSG